jgi:hypothetical protein
VLGLYLSIRPKLFCSLTDDDREDLKKSVVDIFIKEAHREYAEMMMAVANPQNMNRMYEGYIEATNTCKKKTKKLISSI